MSKSPEKNHRVVGVKGAIALVLGGLATGVLVDRMCDRQPEEGEPSRPAAAASAVPEPQDEIVLEQAREEIVKQVVVNEDGAGEPPVQEVSESDKLADAIINDLCIQEEADAEKIRQAIQQGYTKVDAYIEGTLMLTNGEDKMDLNLDMKAGCGAQKLADLHNEGRDEDVINAFELDRLRELLESNGMGDVADRWIADVEELKEGLANASSKEEKSQIACNYVRNKPAGLNDYLKGTDLFDRSRKPGFRRELESLGWRVLWQTLNALSIRLGQDHYYRECHGMVKDDEK